MPVTLRDMVDYHYMLSKIASLSEKVQETIEFLETEIHYAITSMKRAEFK